MKRIDAALLLLVLFGYVYFATAGKLVFPPALAEPRGWDEPGAGYYAELAEGFLRGQTSMAIEPDPRMGELENPYDYGQRDAAKIAYLWDASWYRGRYHLYFTPLPVIFFYVPYRLIAGVNPHDTLAATFFSAWALLAAAMFLRGAMRRPAGLWIVFVGFANLIAFQLSAARIYEVAIMAGMAFSATWAYALLRFHEKPATAWAIQTGFWLALAISARPNLAVLLLPTVLVMRRRFAVALLPMAIVFAANGAYNYARFGDALESGITYQLNYVAMQGQSRCSVGNAPEVMRLVNNTLQYTFLPPRIASEFPFVEAPKAWMDRATSWAGDFEELVGLFPIMPLAAIALLAALLSWREHPVSVAVLGGGWLVLFGLASCWWLVSRYTLDFALLIGAGTAVMIDAGLRRIGAKSARVAAILLALYSIAIGVLFGFEGRL